MDRVVRVFRVICGLSWFDMRILALLTLAFLQTAGGHTIAGRVLDASGRVPSGIELNLCSRDTDDSSGCGPVSLRADGSFTTGPVMPGTYALRVGPSGAGPGDADV